MAVVDSVRAPDGAPPGRRAAYVKVILRLLVSAALLAFLVTKIPAGSVQPKDTHAGTLVFFFAALALTFGGFVLSAWRWQRVLAVFDVVVPLRTLLSHYLAGQFVGNVLPSTIGGDVLRVSRSSKRAGGDVAFASVAIERLTGFVALPLLTFIGFVVKPSLLDLPHAWVAVAISGVTIATLIVVLFVAGHPSLAGRFESHENWMRFIGSVHTGVSRLRREPRRGASVLAAAVAYQAAVVGAVWCAVHALGVSIPDGAVIAFVPAVAMAQVLPISLGGLGIREGLLVLLLHPLGVPTGKAIGVGLLWYGMTLLVSLLGAPAFAVGHRHGEDDDGAGNRADGTPLEAVASEATTR
ncbi:MAG: lysylphosphatidylglycerol synthase transmembrane domain-containing protein [Acidimicrobiia bacterium]